MKKFVSITLALCLTLAAFAGCAPTDPKLATGAGPVESTNSSESTIDPKLQTGPGPAMPQEEEEAKELNLYTWEGMFPPEVLSDFEAETGIKVNYSVFTDGATMLSKLQTAKGGDYDVVITDDYIVELAVKEGLVRELDKALLTNYKSINPLYQGQFYDKENMHTVPYGAGVQTIVYNPSTVNVEITSYADLWDKSLQSNVGIVANARVINGMALKTMGESYNITDLAKIDEAGTKLLELAPNIRLIKDANLQDDLLSGEVGAAIMYTSQSTLAMLANPELKVVYPTEGIGFGIIAQFIPSNAPHPKAAHAFMDYILRPEVSAKCYEYIGYYSTNKDADALITQAYKSFLTLPADLAKDKMEMIQNLTPEAEEAHNKIWTAFKAATE